MCEEEYDMNVIKKETKNRIKEADEKPDLQTIKLGNFKYISTEKGAELLKQFQDMFVYYGYFKNHGEYLSNQFDANMG